MKIVILNGSPKGKTSVTMQYCKYLEQNFSHHQFIRLDISQKMAKIEKNNKYFNDIVEEIDSADIILWAYPLYYLLVQSQYKRFIEFIYEREIENIFKNKYCAILTTSIHFYDSTAVNYIKGVCDDLDMNCVDYITPKMSDLFKDNFRETFKHFFQRVIRYKKDQIPAEKSYFPIDLKKGITKYKPKLDSFNLKTDKNIVIVTDGDSENSNNMVKKINSIFSNGKLLDMNSIKMGPCVGCLKCSFDNICTYQGKDDFIDQHKEKVLNSDIIFFVLTMKDRYFSSKWQKYLERTFYKTHQPTIADKQIIFIIDGPISQNENAQTILKAYCETMGANLLSIISNENKNSEQLDKIMENISKESILFSDNKVIKPKSFLGVAGMKIFRDDVYKGLKLIFQKDHQYYKKHGIYDFPNKNIIKQFGLSFAYVLLKLPFIKKKLKKNMTKNMITQYKKVLKK